MKEPSKIIPCPMPADKRFKNLTGQTFGRLTVVEFAGLQTMKCGVTLKFWLCRCVCGKVVYVGGGSLRTGDIQSCGCYSSEVHSKRLTTHGKHLTPEYRIWAAMHDRCFDPKVKNFHRYGGRGITVCRGWKISFASFDQIMGQRPTPRHTIDRINNDGHYSCGQCDECIEKGWPLNCRWVTKKDNCRNKSNNRMVTFGGRTQCISAWAEERGISARIIWKRLEMGWSEDRAINAPVRVTRQQISKSHDAPLEPAAYGQIIQQVLPL